MNDKTNEKQCEEHAKAILEYIGEDTTREGLVETPKRMRKAWDEIKIGRAHV